MPACLPHYHSPITVKTVFPWENFPLLLSFWHFLGLRYQFFCSFKIRGLFFKAWIFHRTLIFGIYPFNLVSIVVFHLSVLLFPSVLARDITASCSQCKQWQAMSHQREVFKLSCFKTPVLFYSTLLKSL
eukprot:TRINITY_DN26371_c0_g1_i1.p1 TRINITY_DN26371_c0_g1~~TRINITY_DN26371_c0_g1_i1.p1  ORF type:complete len:129 (+),score=6.32 TRINITY_DN26371_c0_g1_i1:19-405(+)